jgi:hypothetical protein
MIRQHICTDNTFAGYQQEMYDFLAASTVFGGVSWIDDADHTKGFCLWYDAEHTDLVAKLLGLDISPSVSSGIYEYVSFTLANGTETYIRDNTSTLYTQNRVIFVETECAFMAIFYRSGASDPMARAPRIFGFTKNRGFFKRNSPTTSSTLSNAQTLFGFKGDPDFTKQEYSPLETVYTCFAPVSGSGITYSNNQLYFTPFTSTPNYPCIVDSDIGKFVTDGFYAFPEFLEEVN